MTPESKTVEQSKAPVDGGGGEWLKLSERLWNYLFGEKKKTYKK